MELNDPAVLRDCFRPLSHLAMHAICGTYALRCTDLGTNFNGFRHKPDLSALVFLPYSGMYMQIHHRFSISCTYMFDSVEGLVLTIISALIIIIFGGAIYGFFRSIFLFIFSGGEPDKIKQARNGIRFMVLGIFLTLIFLFVFPVLFKRLKLPGYEAYTAQNIFRFTSWFLRSILDFGKESVGTYQQYGPSLPADTPTKTSPAEPPAPIEL